MPSIRRNPLDDPLVRTWDAVVTGTTNSEQVDQAAVAVLDRLHAAFDGPEADSEFLNRLESELFSVQAQNGASTTNDASSSSFRNIPLPLTRRELESERAPKLIRLLVDNLAIAAILAIVIGGLAVTYFSNRSEPENANHIPAIIDSREELERALNPPTLETLLDITIDPSLFEGPLPATWETLDFSLTTVKPGVEFSSDHPYFSCCPSLIVLHVMGGSAEFAAEGPASIYRKGASSPESASADEVYPLASGDSVVFSTSSQTVMRNTGQDDLRLLNGRAIDFADSRYMGLKPEGYIQSPHLQGRNLDPPQSEVVQFRFERVLLDPGDLTTVESLPTERLLAWYPERPSSQARFVVGDESAVSAGETGEFLGAHFTIHDFPEGEYTILNTGDEPITLHFLRVTELPDTEPLSIATSPEILLDITIDPAGLTTSSPSTWEAIEFSLTHVAEGGQFSTDHPYFTNGPGVVVFQVMEGSARLEIAGPNDIYRSGVGAEPEHAAPSTPFELSEGDVVAFASSSAALLTNVGERELDLLHGRTFGPDDPTMSGLRSKPDEYRDEPANHDRTMPPLDTELADVSFERIVLNAGGLTTVQASPDERLLGWYPEEMMGIRFLAGDFEELPAGESGEYLGNNFTIHFFPEGPYTLINPDDNPVTLYFMRLSEVNGQPATPGTATADPAPETLETLLDITVKPADLGAVSADNWNQLEFALVRVASGDQFTTDHPFFSCCPGMAVFHVRQGTLSLLVDGPVEVYSSDSTQTPERVEPGTLLPLGPGDTAVFAMERPAVFTNAGPDELLMLGGYAYEYDHITNSPAPAGYVGSPYILAKSMAPIPADTLDVAFESVVLDPGEFLHIEVDPDVRLAGWYPESNTTVRMMAGAQGSLPAENSASFPVQTFDMSNYSAGPYTFYNNGNNSATLHFMRIAAVGLPAAATPVASPVASKASPKATPEATPVAAQQPQPLEALLNIQVSPAELDAQTPDQWDVMEFSLVHVKTGESFTTDDPWFTCCDGMAVFHVRQGSASFVVDGPVDLYTANGDGNPIQIPDALLFALEAGDTAVFAVEHPAIVTNTGDGELLMLGGYAYEFGGPVTSIEPEGYLGQPVVFDTNMDPMPADSLDVSFEQVLLEPGELTHIEARPEERLVGWFPETNTTVRMAMGELDAIPTDPLGSSMVQSFVMNNFSPGPYTFFNAGNNPATLHFMRVAPAGDLPLAIATPMASPVASAASSEVVLNAVVQTDVHSFGSDPGWDQASFTEATLEPSASVSSTDPDFGCCQGLHFITVLDGELTVQMNLPISAVTSGDGSDISDFGNPIKLSTGETAIYEGQMIATNTGSSPARFLHGGVYDSTISADSSVQSQGYFTGKRVMTSVVHDSELLLQSIDIDRAVIEPGQVLQLAVTPNDGLLLLADGGPLSLIPAGLSSPQAPAVAGGAFTGEGLEAGDYELHNPGSTSVTVYILRIGPDRAPPQPGM